MVTIPSHGWFMTLFYPHYIKNWTIYHLVNIKKTMEKHRFWWVNQLFLWSCFNYLKSHDIPIISPFPLISPFFRVKSPFPTIFPWYSHCSHGWRYGWRPAAPRAAARLVPWRSSALSRATHQGWSCPGCCGKSPISIGKKPLISR